MKRLFTQNLIDWKNNKDKMPLLVYGSRQVGKSTSIFEFGKNHYANVILCNFEHNEPLQKIFEKDLDPNRIVLEIEKLTSETISRRHTLLFFDEIQECPKAITSLKYFCEQAPAYHIIAAGSLLGVGLNRKTKVKDENGNTIEKGVSFPVGKVNLLTVYPMTFKEFLMEINPHIISSIEESFAANKPLSELLHNKALELYRTYLFTGGMPKAVLEYSEKKDFDFVRVTQNSILSLYYSDMGKYTTQSEQVKIGAIYNSIPYQLAKENKKFQYSLVGSGVRASGYEIGLHWLKNAGLIIQCNKVKEGKYPLSFYTDALSYKIYMNDVGLLNAKSNIAKNRILSEIDFTVESKGAMTENYVAQEMVANGLIPYYWESKGKAEVDFVVQIGDNSIPVEVKSATNTQSKSLNEYIKKYSPAYSIRISAKNFGFENGIKSVPLYAVWCIK